MNAGILIKIIVTAQVDAGLNETEFSKKLCISRTLWFQMKKGERKPSAKFLSSIITNFPELLFDVMQYLNNGHEVTK